MRTILILLGKDIAIFRRNKAAVVVTFVVPIALIYLFGLVFGINRKDNGPSGFPLAVVNESHNPAAQALVDALKADPSFRVTTTAKGPGGAEHPLTAAEARAAIHDHDYNFALVLPSDLVSDQRFGLHLQILSNPRNDIETQMVNGLLQKAIFTHVPQLLGQTLQTRARNYLGAERLQGFNHRIADTVAASFGGDPAAIEHNIANGNFGFDAVPGTATASGTATGTAGGATADAEDFLSRVVKIDREQVVGKDVKSPEATRIIGGQAIMFLLFAVSNGAAAFFDEKNAGIFQRLLSLPVTRAQLLWSRFLWGIVLGLVQLLTLFLAGQVMFGIDVTGHLLYLLPVCICAAAACSAFGMLVAAFSPNQQAASGLSTLLVLTMSATGGAWFPLFLMPLFMQKVAKFTLVYWTMEGFSQVLWAGDGFLSLLPTLGILLAISGVVMSLAIWRFNRRNIFG